MTNIFNHLAVTRTSDEIPSERSNLHFFISGFSVLWLTRTIVYVKGQSGPTCTDLNLIANGLQVKISSQMFRSRRKLPEFSQKENLNSVWVVPDVERDGGSKMEASSLALSSHLFINRIISVAPPLQFPDFTRSFNAPGWNYCTQLFILP